MKGKRWFSLLSVGLVLTLLSSLFGSAGITPGPARAQDGEAVQPEAGLYSYAFTYQGQLKDAGGPVNGPCDFDFGLWDDPSGGTQWGPVKVHNLTLVDGLFTARLDFGAAAHTGGARWLEVAVRCPAGSGSWVTLTPRQELTGAPTTLALALPSTAQGSADGALFSIANTGLGSALNVSSANEIGVRVESAGTTGVLVLDAGNSGVRVSSAVWSGLSVGTAGDDGVNVYSAGSPPGHSSSFASNGFEVAGAEGFGLYVGDAGAGGVWVNSAAANGVGVASAGLSGVSIGTAADDGLYVGNVGADGVYVDSAGNPWGHTSSELSNGFEVAGAEGHGLYVGGAGVNGVHVNYSHWDGVYVSGAANNGVYVGATDWDGVYVSSAANNGVYVGATGNDGVHVGGAGHDGVYAHTNQASHEWGFYTPDKIYAGSALASAGPSIIVAQNGDAVALEPGDVVVVSGLGALFAGSEFPAPLVRRAGQGNSTVAGVVYARFVAEEQVEEAENEGQVETRTSPHSRSAEGPVAPGEYLLLVVLGPAQVRASAAAGSFAAGDLLAVTGGGQATLMGAAGYVPGSLVGTAMESLDAAEGSGLIWVLVNPR